MITTHDGWIRQGRIYRLITGLDIACGTDAEIQLNKSWHSAEFVFENCVFVDDGTSVGEKIKTQYRRITMLTNKCTHSGLCTALFEAAEARRRIEKCTIYS